MAIPAFLMKAYFSAEDAYYKLADFLQKKLHIPVYKYYIEPIENTGTPSFPVTLALLAAILLLIGVAIVGAPRLAFQVTVMHGSIPVEGAQVTLSGGNYYVELATDDNGVALFEDLQDGAKLDLAVNKEGYRSKQATITVKKEGTTVKLFREGEAETGAGGEVSVSVVVTNDAGAPVGGASVSYQFEQQANAGSTDSEGRYAFGATQGTAVSVTVSKTGFQTATSSFTASEGFSKTIALTLLSTDPRLGLRGTGLPVPSDGVNTNGSGDTEYSGITVEVKGKNGTNYTSARVRLYNARNDAKINEATATARQAAAFSRIAVGTEVYAIAEATGFSSNKSNKTIITRSQTRIVLEITNLTQMTYNPATGEWCDSSGHCIHINPDTGDYEDDNGTEVSEETLATMGVTLDVYAVDNATGRTAASAQIALQDAAGAPLYEARANAAGKASFADLTLGSSFTIFASKTDYFPYWSPAPFEAGSAPNYTARLVKGDENNSGNLSAHVYALNGTGPVNITNADVSLVVNGTRWPETKKTDRNGIAVFKPLPVGVTAVADASIDQFTATNSTTIQKGSNGLELLVLTPEYNLTVNVVDYVRNTSTAANVKVYWPDDSSEANLVAACDKKSSENCLFTLYTQRNYLIKAEASGFATISRRYMASDASTREASILIQMIPFTGNLLLYEGLYYYDESGAEHQQAPGEPLPGMCIGEGCPPSNYMAFGYWAFELRPTQVYHAKFMLYLKNNTQETVFYVRAGETNRRTTDTGSDNAAIAKMFTDLSGTVFDSQLFDSVTGSKGPSCPRPTAAQEDGLYKWMEVRVSAENYSSQFVEVSVPIIATSTNHNQFTLYYRAAARVNDSSYLTEPLDEAFTPSTESSKRCSANSKTANFTKPSGELSYSFSCTDKGCIKTSYRQGDRKGGSNFAVSIPRTVDESEGSADLLHANYTVIDFSPALPDSDEVDEYSFGEMPRDRLWSWPVGEEHPEFRWTTGNFEYYTQVTSTKKQGEVILTPLEGELADTLLNIVHELKNKASLETVLSLVYEKAGTPPNSTYLLRYNSTTHQLDLFLASDTAFEHPIEQIGMMVTPVFPADAVYLKLDSTSMPSDCLTSELYSLPLVAVTPNDVTKCIEFDSQTELIKVDASKRNPFGHGECNAYSPNPNDFHMNMRGEVVNLTVSPACGPGGPLLSKTISIRVIGGGFATHALSIVPAWKAGYNGVYVPPTQKELCGTDEACSETHITNLIQPVVVINNRQYGSLEPTQIIYTPQNPEWPQKIISLPQSMLDGPGVLPLVIDLGASLEDVVQRIKVVSGDVELGRYSVFPNEPPLDKESAHEALSNTVFFRRAEEDMGFPYTAFVPSDDWTTKPIRFYWISNSGRVPYVVIESSNCTDDNERGFFVNSLGKSDGKWSELDSTYWLDQSKSEVVSITPGSYALLSGDMKCTHAPESTSLCGSHYLQYESCPYNPDSMTRDCSNCLIPADWIYEDAYLESKDCLNYGGYNQSKVGAGLITTNFCTTGAEELPSCMLKGACLLQTQAACGDEAVFNGTCEGTWSTGGGTMGNSCAFQPLTSGTNCNNYQFNQCNRECESQYDDCMTEHLPGGGFFTYCSSDPYCTLQCINEHNACGEECQQDYSCDSCWPNLFDSGVSCYNPTSWHAEIARTCEFNHADSAYSAVDDPCRLFQLKKVPFCGEGWAGWIGGVVES
ncbi:carboxypeptidase regulatory-like domain-containing protein [Candidatus Micrarchaeota archaeon]|nr:carboxypeptidase regulatory-like domain-containing protein [Candidatus Micrarchaeota archaeon]